MLGPFLVDGFICPIIFLHILPGEMNGSIVGATALQSQRNLRGLPSAYFLASLLRSHGVLIFYGRKSLRASCGIDELMANRWTYHSSLCLPDTEAYTSQFI